MKATAITVLSLLGAAGAAGAHGDQDKHRHQCRFCITITTWERQEVRERRIVGYENKVVGYRDVMVEKIVTEYEERCVEKRVIVGYSCDGPIYEIRRVRERVPVCRTIQVCEKQPIVERCPIYEDVVCYKWVKVPVTICRR